MSGLFKYRVYYTSDVAFLKYLQSADVAGISLCRSCLCRRPPQTCSSWWRRIMGERRNTDNQSLELTQYQVARTEAEASSHPSRSMCGRCFGVPLRCFLWKWLKSSFSGCTSQPAPLQLRGGKAIMQMEYYQWSFRQSVWSTLIWILLIVS